MEEYAYGQVIIYTVFFGNRTEEFNSNVIKSIDAKLYKTRLIELFFGQLKKHSIFHKNTVLNIYFLSFKRDAKGLYVSESVSKYFLLFSYSSSEEISFKEILLFLISISLIKTEIF